MDSIPMSFIDSSFPSHQSFAVKPKNEDLYKKSLVKEQLTVGMELTKQLSSHLDSSPTSLQTREFLVQQILCSYDNALLALKSGDSKDKIPKEESPVSHPLNEMGIRSNKRRKVWPKQMHLAKVCPERGVIGPVEDGFSWRKYGQKVILGAKYPRSYFRCTYRHLQDCWATKQVQRSEDDPFLFEVTYKGSHNCCINPTQEHEHKNTQFRATEKDQQNMQSSFGVQQVEDFDFHIEGMNFPFSTSPPFSFDDSETLSNAPFNPPPMYQDSEAADVFSVVNSPILDLDYSFGSFPLDILEFLS